MAEMNYTFNGVEKKELRDFQNNENAMVQKRSSDQNSPGNSSHHVRNTMR